ncbi:amidohydrolase family protein [Methanococcoides burtonii]|uniref:5'-deoxyadenosine deaminase n=1 Tax=Methanococcoides burtonii (strain DSM 6242 / NBRC 107633 / OCM 468 / ACE-M) TaxID=259564 RepID=DADD_METBU|nr:amidohydrolase family protein [Methanococcoides burtonii]Q12WS1.1 RecName: Full=5'-deoxyadenosine deaminase; Short=5'-dA deaminase; AltName: Full=5'-methylthioadenosine deaminase; Short=MTA deaminase; AltName: Full=Adenosine deaminase; AltName: Full=S-adenosylhomocysteine deaminase; Short=SAH deaminase [Methanococcoides burtonii DSM 6242]ABE52105.1 metal-dependent hydrolase [Methanococcoides burtonii DSM 6242]
MADIIIKNGYVLTMDPEVDDIPNGVVVIEGGKIVEVAETTSATANTVIDAQGGVVMPGFVNTHTHAGMTLFRGYADDLPLAQWLQEHIWPAEAELTASDVLAGTRLACLEMIKSGTIAFADMYFFMEEVGKAVEECGLRAALSYGMIELWDDEKGTNELKKGREFVKEWNGKAEGRISVMYGPHAPNTCSKEFLSKVKEQAIADNVKIHIHVLETEAELNQMKEQYGMCSVNMLDTIDFFGPGVLAAHCIWLSDGDMDILADNNVNIAHNPVSNMKLASGVAPVMKLLDKGANVCLGTDGCASNNNLDMFDEMKTAALLQKVDTMDPTALPAKQVLEMATVNGAKALDINSGVLRKDYNADVIIIDMNKAHLSPLFDVPSQLVYSATGNDVRTTIVNGVVLMDERKVLCMNEQQVINDAKQAASDLVSRVDAKN